jgi:hypothetical protein
MTPMDHHSEELHALQELEEAREREAFGGVCPGPVDMFTTTLDRRGFLKVGTGGLLSLLFAQWLDPSAAWAQGKSAAKAKNCILLWMNGGPSHLETFDPKPGAVTGGPTKAVKTKVAGIEISEHVAALADYTDEMTIVRGMTSKEGNHQRAQYLLHTGYAPTGSVVHPSLGSWVSSELGDPKSDLPSFVSISGPSIGAAFLGVQHGPFVVQNPGQLPQNIAYPRNVNTERFQQRQEALNILESQFAAETGDSKVKGRRDVYTKAVKMMHSPRLKAFDLAEESEATKQAYGNTNFGRGCLMARRLVESGVKFVEVVLDGWDTHQDNFNRVARQAGTFAPAMAALIKDLKERNMLDSTLVIWMGEFGRTPRINPNEGRDHYPQAWNAVLAGGGTRKGIVYGQTDETGAKVVHQPVIVPDFFATVATLLGMNPDKAILTPVGRPISITEKGKPVSDLIA